MTPETAIREKADCVYIVSYAEIPDAYKIGSTSNLNKRINALECACPFEIVLIYAFRATNAGAIERLLHKKFSKQRIKREWFKLSRDDLAYIRSIECIEQIVIERSLPVIRNSMPTDPHHLEGFKAMGRYMDEWFHMDESIRPASLNDYMYSRMSLDEIFKLYKEIMEI